MNSSNSVVRLLTTLFSFSGTLKRKWYILIALIGASAKHPIDRAIAGSFYRHWDWSSYLMPVGFSAHITTLSVDSAEFLASMLAASLPFAWVGLAITAKRFRTIGWPPWLIVLFFIPVANIASFFVAAAWPDREEATSNNLSRPRLARFVPADTMGAAIFAIILTALGGTALIGLGTHFLTSYGWGLFAALPFAQGALSAYIFSLNGQRSFADCAKVASVSIALAGLALLTFALEGAVCIFMAAPIALAFAILGAYFGYIVGLRATHVNVAMLLTCIFLSPAIMGAEVASDRIAPTYQVTTSVDIDASAQTVWKNVVSFPDLPPPTELPFRAGIAYPIRAKISGSGVGAIRYCEFSTGDFVEPITVWEPEHKLAFSVTHSAEPMREWSPYGHIDVPHLHGYMVSRHGEFALTALPNGRTRLTGTTWYQHNLWPATYWAMWSDEIVHEIHLRVLNHIKAVSEART